MRILLVTHFYPPGHLGGTEVLTQGLARSLAASGHDVEVVCAEDWETAPGYRVRPSRESIDGVTVNRLRFNWKKAPDVFRALYDNPETERWLTGLIGRFRPEVCHITSCGTLSASVITAAVRLGVPTMLSATDFWFLCARNTLLQPDGSLCTGPEAPWKCATCMLCDAKALRWPRTLMPERAVEALLQRLARVPLVTNRRGFRGMLGDWQARLDFLGQALQRVDRIVTASGFLRDLFVRYGVDPRRVQHSPYGLDLKGMASPVQKTPSSRLRVGFIGQLIPAKAPDLLIRAIRHLPPAAGVEAHIYGDVRKDPAYGRMLLELAGGDGRIAFRGTFHNALMGQVLADIDLLVVPSIWYDFPLVIPSAFAAGTPVVATDLPGMNELVRQDVDGLLFARHDWKGLAAQISRLVATPGLLSRLRDQIRPVKTIEAFAAECVAGYESIAAGHGARRLP